MNPHRSAKSNSPTSSALRKTADPVTRRWNLIEYHRRLSLPTACIVLALVGIPLGLSSKKGGKSSGFVLTILLVFLYYSISLIGVSFARQGHLSPAAGVWLADFVFLVGGVFLLWQSERRPIELTAVRSWFKTSWFRTSGFRTSGSRNGPMANSSAMHGTSANLNPPIVLPGGGPSRPIARTPVAPGAGYSIFTSRPSSTTMCCAALHSTSP